MQDMTDSVNCYVLTKLIVTKCIPGDFKLPPYNAILYNHESRLYIYVSNKTTTPHYDRVLHNH